jgi:CBS domain-containing protein
MPDILVNQDSFFFIAVDFLCKRPSVTCTPKTGVVEMATLMQEHNISGIVVVEGIMPVGIVSLRDLRDLVAHNLENLANLTVGEVMRTNLITIGRHDYLFKAIFKMARNNIHRLIVLNHDGSLAGVITNTDLLRVQTRCPLYLSQEIEATEDFEQLRKTGLRMTEMLQFATRSGADTQSLISLIAHFNDAMTLRIFELLDRLEGIRLPAGAAWLALGSEGRGEQTLRTDQDNAIVYDDGLPQKDLDQIKLFAERVVERLEFIGVPLCPGGTMASNPEWRHSVSEWKQILTRWITTPSANNMVNFGMFQDMRTLYGSAKQESVLREHIIVSTGQHSLFFPYMARNIVRFKPPMGMFGRIKTDTRGEYRGTFDLKKGGIFALTLGLSLLALRYGSMGGNSWEKIARLRETGKISAHDLDQVEESFSFLLKLRLQKQFRALEAGKQPNNRVDPLVLTEREREQLRAAFNGVNLLLHILEDTFQLGMIAR